ncbi:MAG: MATE family efflux transporter [Candidatus Aenigmarchaeota archaeon]|nr:MATE family efflux transporter [Candidatus Aenigmarchaeota archaeon]
MRRHFNDLTEGPILKPLISLAIPIIIANILQSAYQITDAFWIGKLGAGAVASISLSFPIIFLMASIASGLSVAGSILVSQYKGKNDRRNIDYISAQTILLVLLTSILIAVLGYLSAESIIHLTGAEQNVAMNAVSYLKVSFLGIVFVFGYFVVQSLMRGVGNTKTPMLIVMISVALNLVLDPLFILGFGVIPGMGVTGAAFATVITQSIAYTIGIALLLSGRYGIHLKKQDFKIDSKSFSRLLRLGLPASVAQGTRALGMTVLTFLVAGFGTVATASYGISVMVISLIIIPAMGFSMATSTMVGQSMGAKKIERVMKITKISSTIMLISLSATGVFMMFFAEHVVSVFIPEDPSVIESAALFIRLTALTFGFIGVQQVLNGVFRGVGDTMIVMMFSLFSLFVLRIPMAYIFSIFMNLRETGVWLSFPISNILATVFVVLLFIKGTWKEKKVI